MPFSTAKPRSVENYCPVCGESIPVESINITEGVALCPQCGQLSRLSEVVSQKRPIREILAQPPTGCSVTEWGQDVVVYASCRSISSFIAALLFSLFWNGIVSVFVVVVAGAIYTNVVGPLPAWFPAPDMKPAMSPGMTVFMCLFLTPFVAIGLGLIVAMIMSLAGKVEVSLAETQASVRTGISFLTWRSRFDPAAVRRVTIGTSNWQNNEKSTPVIVIEADRTLKFGSMLTEERREWMQAFLHQWFTRPEPNQRLELLTLTRRAASGF
jgi:hypothetical protein